MISRRATAERSSSRRPEKSSGCAEVDGDPGPVPAAVARAQDVLGADQPDRHDRRARTQRQAGDAGAELVEPAVAGAGALGVDAEHPAAGQQLGAGRDRAEAAARVSSRSTGMWPSSRNHQFRNRPRTPGWSKYSALAK